jgi:thiol-disulfide isomerase/thioredoxin
MFFPMDMKTRLIRCSLILAGIFLLSGCDLDLSQLMHKLGVGKHGDAAPPAAAPPAAAPPAAAPPAAVPPAAAETVKAEEETPAEVAPEPVVDCITNGMTEAAMLAVLGTPKGVMRAGDRRVLIFSGGTVELADGVVTNIPDGSVTVEHLLTERSAIKTGTRQEAYRGDPLYRDLVTVGKITVIDFYATGSDPCRQLAPVLDQYIQSQPDVVLRKVDIRELGSPTAEKYKISSVPNLRVFDREGKMVGRPASSLEQVQKYVEKARRR